MRPASSPCRPDLDVISSCTCSPSFTTAYATRPRTRVPGTRALRAAFSVRARIPLATREARVLPVRGERLAFTNTGYGVGLSMRPEGVHHDRPQTLPQPNRGRRSPWRVTVGGRTPGARYHQAFEQFVQSTLPINNVQETKGTARLSGKRKLSPGDTPEVCNAAARSGEKKQHSRFRARASKGEKKQSRRHVPLPYRRQFLNAVPPT